MIKRDSQVNVIITISILLILSFFSLASQAYATSLSTVNGDFVILNDDYTRMIYPLFDDENLVNHTFDEQRLYIMDDLSYAGTTDWEMATLDEIRTIIGVLDLDEDILDLDEDGGDLCNQLLLKELIAWPFHELRTDTESESGLNSHWVTKWSTFTYKEYTRDDSLTDSQLSAWAISNVAAPSPEPFSAWAITNVATPSPEPSTIFLFFFGLLALVGLRKRFL